MVQVMEFIKVDAESAETVADANELWKVGAFLSILMAGSLRGYEGFYTELAGLIRHLDKGRDGVISPKMNKNTELSEDMCMNLPHVAITLLGKFKGETVVDHHIINVANSSISGLQTRWWIEKLVQVCRSEGRSYGPAFATPDGAVAASSDYDAVFRKYLQKVQDETDLIPKDSDVDSMYGISRTPRKTAVSRAKQAGYDDKLDEVNRWRSLESAQGRRVKRKMNVHYSEALLMMPTTWRVSYAQ